LVSYPLRPTIVPPQINRFPPDPQRQSELAGELARQRKAVVVCQQTIDALHGGVDAALSLPELTRELALAQQRLEKLEQAWRLFDTGTLSVRKEAAQVAWREYSQWALEQYPLYVNAAANRG
jgi:hypothetical protein